MGEGGKDGRCVGLINFPPLRVGCLEVWEHQGLWDCFTFIQVFKQSIRYAFQILKKLEFSRHIFEESLYIKYPENPSSGIGVVPCGRADGQTVG